MLLKCCLNGISLLKATAPSNSDQIILVYYWTAQYAIKYVAREVCQVFIRAGKMVEYGIFTVQYGTGL